MSSVHEHLEQTEHAAHGISNPFNQRVAVSMAIIAAILAGISMLGHRKHNEVLQLQGDSNRLQTEASIMQTKANIDHTKASDGWAYYQAVNIRSQMYSADIEMMDVLGRDSSKGKAEPESIKSMKAKVAKYKPELEKLKHDAEELVATAEKKQLDSLEIQEKATAKLDDSHHAHAQADRLDYAHLGAEIGLVICSIALLTRKKLFWLIGIAAALAAIGTATSAYLIAHEPHHAHSAPSKDEHSNRT